MPLYPVLPHNYRILQNVDMREATSIGALLGTTTCLKHLLACFSDNQIQKKYGILVQHSHISSMTTIFFVYVAVDFSISNELL